MSKTPSKKKPATKQAVSKQPATKKTAAKAAKKLPAKKLPAKKAATKSAAKRPAAKQSAAKPAKSATKKSGAKSVRGQPATLAKQRADPGLIAARLGRAISQAECELAFNSPFELLTATILAAQSTDKTVNQVMPVLLSHYPTAEALAGSSQEDVETLIKRTGFFRNKAKAIRGMAQHLVAEHSGLVPRTIEQMVELPGVARKTANVVLGTAYGISSGFIVDTHVTRVSQRLALSGQSDPIRIEQDLCGLFPQSEWVDLGHRLVLHGRYTCLAKRPMCEDCAINELCPSRQAGTVDRWEDRAQRQDLRTSAGLLGSRGH